MTCCSAALTSSSLAQRGDLLGLDIHSLVQVATGRLHAVSSPSQALGGERAPAEPERNSRPVSSPSTDLRLSQHRLSSAGHVSKVSVRLRMASVQSVGTRTKSEPSLAEYVLERKRVQAGGGALGRILGQRGREGKGSTLCSCRSALLPARCSLLSLSLTWSDPTHGAALCSSVGLLVLWDICVLCGTYCHLMRPELPELEGPVLVQVGSSWVVFVLLCGTGTKSLNFD